MQNTYLLAFMCLNLVALLIEYVLLISIKISVIIDKFDYKLQACKQT